MATVGSSGVSNKTHYARLSHAAQNLIPRFLQEVLLSYEYPKFIYSSCRNNQYLKDHLKSSDWTKIQRAVVTDSYKQFDIPLIYTILRNAYYMYIKLQPTSGWDSKFNPQPCETNIGDDIERCRRIRNKIIHRGNTEVSNQELNEYFVEFRAIASRLQVICDKQNNEFVSEVEDLQTCCMDEDTERKYLEKIEEMRCRAIKNEAQLTGNRLGDHDIVRCFCSHLYLSVHSRHSPNCCYLRRVKGQNFIDHIQEDWRKIYNPKLIDTGDIINTFSNWPNYIVGPSSIDIATDRYFYTVAQTRDNLRERKIKDILDKQEFKDIVNFGYSKNSIRMATEEVLKDTGDFKFTPQHVLNKILDIQERDDFLPVDDDDDETEEANKDAEKCVEENKKLKQQMICWKCSKKEICMLFTPCGHRLTCEDCARSINNCLKCNKEVKKRIKTFLA